VPEPREPRVRELHGERLSDEFAWLEEPTSSQVRQLMKAEIAHSQYLLQETAELRQALAARLHELAEPAQASLPDSVDKFDYFTLERERLGMPLFMRRERTTGKEQLVLDPNKIATQSMYVNVGLYRVSPCHR
jgi:protease II